MWGVTEHWRNDLRENTNKQICAAIYIVSLYLNNKIINYDTTVPSLTDDLEFR